MEKFANSKVRNALSETRTHLLGWKCGEKELQGPHT